MVQQEGPGWRLSRDISRNPFPVLIGGENWAFELTEYEWTILAPLIGELLDEHQRLESQLMPEESISLEIERNPWWACIEGDRNSWSLKVVLEGALDGSRSVEGFWPGPASQAIALAMRTMWDSSQ